MRITAIIAIVIAISIAIGAVALLPTAAGLQPAGAQAAPPAQGGANTPANQAAVTRISFTGAPAANSSYATDERIRIKVKFDRVVTVTGEPYVNLQVGAQQRPAAYQRGSGSQSLIFIYRVQLGDRDRDGVSVPAGAVNLNSGSIRSADGTAASLTHTGIVADATRKVKDTSPTFGTASIDGQTYIKGTAIADLLLPAATLGDAPLTYALTTPPDGLTFTAATRTLSGTPAIGQAATAYTYTVTDVDGEQATLAFNITVAGDYDSDDNGLIEVDRLSQLDAIRWDLDGNGAVDTGTADADSAKYTAAFPNAATGMGCQLVDHDDNAATAKTPVCTGYELTQNLDFDTDDDGATYTVSAAGAVTVDSGDTYYNGGKGWTPMGLYTATFDGKGHTIANLFSSATDTGNLGLFSGIAAGGVVRNLGLANVRVTRTSNGGVTGSLVGDNQGTVANCYATGTVATVSATGSGLFTTGGLSGYLRRGGAIRNSYAAVAVSGAGITTAAGRSRIGGLVGRASNAGSSILASYATGPVVGGDYGRAGGLVGTISNGVYADAITASYATGVVTTGANGRAGGLTGLRESAVAVNSYYRDNGSAGLSDRADGIDKTTRELQSLTGYTGIYANWNVDVDNADGDNNTATGVDDPWEFGTSRQYPVLKHGVLDPAQQRQTSIQSDNWNAPVVGEPVTAGQNATDDANVTWQWQSSAAGATWTNIAGATSATYIPVAADAASGGKFLRAQVTFTLSGASQTLTTANTAKVLTANTAAAGAAATVLTMVGKPLNYHHAAVTAAGAANRTAWRWQRCDDAAMTTNCKLPAQTNPTTDAHTEYTPVAGADTDVGKYLRAYVYYANSGVWTRTQTPVLGPVVAAPAPPPATTTPSTTPATPAPTTP